MNKFLVIIGPTSSGKSELAVKLAKRFNGEIISCDSRQIYRGMDLGTGKVEGKWLPYPSPLARGDTPKGQRGRSDNHQQTFVYKSIPHHLIDFANPKKQYSVFLFQKQAKRIITDILERGRLPILCGGTGHWIDAVVFDQHLPEVKPNPKLRAKLEKKSVDELYCQLKKFDPHRATNIDRFNKRRLIRALEIVITTKKPVPPLPSIPAKTEIQNNGSPIKSGMENYHTLWLGINPPQDILYSKIKKRLEQRLKNGMIAEVKELHRQGLSWKRLMDFGLEYKFVSLYLQKKINHDEMFEQLLTAIKHYSKRQITWWRRNKNIKWIKTETKANKVTSRFLK